MNSVENFIKWSKESISLKIFVISFFILILMIPLNMVDSLIFERSFNKKNVEKEIYNIWGNSQTIKGPVLTVPYYVYVKNNIEKDEMKYLKKIKYAYFLPNSLDIKANLIPKILYRSIYKAVVYKSKINISANFSEINFSSWDINKKDILYDKAQISFGLSDLRGLKDRVKININKKNRYFTPGTGNSFLKKGISFNWPINKKY